MADYLKLLVPRQLVVSVVIVVNCQDYGVYEDDKNDEVFEQVRASKAHDRLS